MELPVTLSPPVKAYPAYGFPLSILYAVSYTHLDVYKRQGSRCPARFLSAEALPPFSPVSAINAGGAAPPEASGIRHAH